MPFIDAGDLPGDSEIVADLIVIGGGMAGLALAREWAGSARSVAVIESGGKTFDPAVQDLYRGAGVMRGPDSPDQPFDDYVGQSRRRMLGGSGMIWGGKCVALDPADFARRDWVPGSGWPISRAAIQPYYDRACDLLEIAHFPPGETGLDVAGKPALAIGDRKAFFSAPRRFTKFSGGVDKAAYDRWRFAPAEAANVTVYLNANVTELRLAADGQSLARLDLACLNGRRHTARGRVYVLATGGIENARLLLASNTVAAAGVGNGAGLVGRHFQGHVVFSVDDRKGGRTSGVYLSGTDNDMTLYTDGSKGAAHCVFAPTLAGQKARRGGNCTITLNSFRTPAPVDPELAALQQLAGGVDRGAPVARADRDLSCFVMTEHAPNPESRVSLGDSSDALGVPRVKLEWTWSEADWRRLESSVAAFGQALGEAGLGRLAFPAERSRYLAMAATSASRHHMGTTRMHRDPAQGVVDDTSRVHGVDNLYVAGSSVFPTSGIGNPTLTLLAMTMRLSDHLKSHLARAA
ncbi:MAG: GMC family oxidoreductase [Alphaproteobacteria bacterium]|nr:GMC family oxidoreductase [Alphaproteobacteria bacterium]MBU1513031.1 GMC family oxidoreductase [Alphaproteobacteria bacterium]MBU2095139.1 GMC family oxidoreductase [Alphaproteobacteria bacterium]MBU2152120.1 GMC family oxidoreductase [Alphaproteobacteria bacterium]MBU2306390.1 GMC family oxidoreductase [Alphaproteobacteria bacterium]